MTEAIIMAILELSMVIWSSKASMVIKMDMVNPMPANKPMPTMFFHFKPLGKEQIPKETLKKENRKII